MLILLHDHILANHSTKFLYNEKKFTHNYVKIYLNYVKIYLKILWCKEKTLNFFTCIFFNRKKISRYDHLLWGLLGFDLVKINATLILWHNFCLLINKNCYYSWKAKPDANQRRKANRSHREMAGLPRKKGDFFMNDCLRCFLSKSSPTLLVTGRAMVFSIHAIATDQSSCPS